MGVRLPPTAPAPLSGGIISKRVVGLAWKLSDSFGDEIRLMSSLGYLTSWSLVARQGLQCLAGVEVLIDSITMQY